MSDPVIVEAVARDAYERDRVRYGLETSRQSGPWESLGHRDDPHGTVQRYLVRAQADIEAHVAVLTANGFKIIQE